MKRRENEPDLSRDRASIPRRRATLDSPEPLAHVTLAQSHPQGIYKYISINQGYQGYEGYQGHPRVISRRLSGLHEISHKGKRRFYWTDYIDCIRVNG